MWVKKGNSQGEKVGILWVKVQICGGKKGNSEWGKVGIFFGEKREL